MLDRTLRAGKPRRELAEITAATDTRDYLARATRQALAYDDYELMVDIDAHLQEGGFWHEIIGLIENDVLMPMRTAVRISKDRCARASCFRWRSRPWRRTGPAAAAYSRRKE